MMTKWSIHGPARQLAVRHFLQLIEQLVSSLPQLTGDTLCRTLPQPLQPWAVILVLLVNMVDIIPSSQLVIGNGAFSIVYRARLKIVSIRSNRRILTTLHTLKRETEMLQGPDSWCSGLCNWKYFRSDEFKRCLTNWLSTPTAFELTTYKS